MSNFVSIVLMVGVCALSVMSVYKLICVIRDRKDAKRKKEIDLSSGEQSTPDNGKGGIK